MSTKWIDYSGKKILYTDYRGLQEAQLVQAIEAQAQMVRMMPHKVLILDNITDVNITKDFMNRAKELGKEIIETKTLKNAIVGVTGIKKVFVQTYNFFTGGKSHAFEKEIDALEWLIKK